MAMPCGFRGCGEPTGKNLANRQVNLRGRLAGSSSFAALEKRPRDVRPLLFRSGRRIVRDFIVRLGEFQRPVDGRDSGEDTSVEFRSDGGVAV